MTLDFDEKDLAILGKALSFMPYGEVVSLISKLQAQIDRTKETKAKDDGKT